MPDCSILTITEVAHHDQPAIVFPLYGQSVAPLGFCDFVDFPSCRHHRALFSVKSRLVHDRSTAGALLCLPCRMGTKRNYVKNIFGIEHNLRSLKQHVVPGCRFLVQFESESGCAA